MNQVEREKEDRSKAAERKDEDEECKFTTRWFVCGGGGGVKG